MKSHTCTRLITVILLALCGCLANAAEQSLRVAVISDINGRYGSTDYSPRVATAIKKLTDLAPDVVISAGDMVAGQRTSPPLSREELEAMWRNFRDNVHLPLNNAGIPLVMTPGNHDASAYPGFEGERATYAEYLRTNPPLFIPDPGGNFPFYFSTRIGKLTLISLDATRTGALDDTQRKWLRGALDEAKTAHTLVFGHLPLQPFGNGRERDIISDPELEAMLQEASVSAYLSGHHHAYYPGRRLGLDMLGMGNLGGNQRNLTGTDKRTGFSFSLLELHSNGKTDVTAYLAPDFNSTLDITKLPAIIGVGEHQLERRDLAVTRPSPDSAGAPAKLTCEQTQLTTPGECQVGDGKVGFSLQATNDGSLNTLTLTPLAMTVSTEPVSIEIDGSAYLAELADLDGNGWPEVYVYIRSAGSGSYGSLVAYAVNQGKSATPIYLPPLNSSSAEHQGYQGHDEFRVVENRLVRRYPIYLDADINAHASGGTRQVQYRLEAGEAGWLLVVDRIVEY